MPQNTLKKAALLAISERYVLGDIIKEAIDKLKGKKISKHELARRLNKEYPHLFYSIEQARTSIRFHTGCRGDRLRKQVLDKSYFNKI